MVGSDESIELFCITRGVPGEVVVSSLFVPDYALEVYEEQGIMRVLKIRLEYLHLDGRCFNFLFGVSPTWSWFRKVALSEVEVKSKYHFNVNQYSLIIYCIINKFFWSKFIIARMMILLKSLIHFLTVLLISWVYNYCFYCWTSS